MARVSHSKTSRSSYRIQVLDRALAALAALAESSSDCSLAELCPALGLHKSTAHRLMMVLEQHRLVVKNPDTGRYRLGLRLYELGSRAIDGLDLRGKARPYLEKTAEILGEIQSGEMTGRGGECHARLRIWGRRSKIDRLSGTLFSHCFDILFSRRGCAHRHRVAYGSVPPEAIQFLGHRTRFYFSDSFLVDSRPGIGTVSDHKPI